MVTPAEAAVLACVGDGAEDLLLARARERWGIPATPESRPLLAGRLRHVPAAPQEGLDAADDPEAADTVADVLRRSAVGAWATRFGDAVSLYRTPGAVAGAVGCTSGMWRPTEAGGLLHVFVTIDDPIGAADGILHELAHLRLLTLGVDLEAHDGELLRNSCERTLRSPIRRDVLRPYSAVLHGIYAWAFMLENELASGALAHLCVNVPKVRYGLDVLERNVDATPAGAAFLEAFFAWAHGALVRAEAALVAAGVPEINDWKGELDALA